MGCSLVGPQDLIAYCASIMGFLLGFHGISGFSIDEFPGHSCLEFQ